MKPPKTSRPQGSFVMGVIALIFLIIGFEVALFVHKASLTHVAVSRDHPDTVYVYVTPDDGGVEKLPTVRKEPRRTPSMQALREQVAPRKVENFRFNPNTVSTGDLQRLGFSEKQAAAIDHYRQKGGRFRRKADFARSFVVADSVYARLEPYIDIPLLDINQADSVALLALPGIGPFFAGKIVQYRAQLGGYSTPEQLMEIWHFDREKYDGLSDLITCSRPASFPLWTLPEADLARHPYLSRSEAHGIVLFRTHHAPSECTLEALFRAGVLSQDHYTSLSRILILDAQ